MSNDGIQEVLDALKQHGGNKTEAAKSLSMTRSRFRRLLVKAAAYGLDGSVPEPLPPGMRIKATSTLYNAETGTPKLIWVKACEDQTSPDDMADILREAFNDCKGGARLAPPPKAVRVGRLGLLCVADLHMGLYSWRPETGNNWSLERAMKVFRDAFQAVLSASPSCEECIILGGGDQMHSDNNRAETTKGTRVDVDGRYDKVLIETCHLFVYAIDLALRKHGKVTVRILKGNHDIHSSVGVAYFLLAWFRNEPRVTVDISPSLFWWYRFGKVQLGATHGHEAKMKDMPGIMSHRRAADWGVTKHRYVHTFHVHHTSLSRTENNGVICESWQTPAPQEAWNYGCGYLSGRSLSMVIYDKDRGEMGRVRMGIEDDV